MKLSQMAGQHFCLVTHGVQPYMVCLRYIIPHVINPIKYTIWTPQPWTISYHVPCDADMPILGQGLKSGNQIVLAYAQ